MPYPAPAHANYIPGRIIWDFSVLGWAVLIRTWKIYWDTFCTVRTHYFFTLVFPVTPPFRFWQCIHILGNKKLAFGKKNIQEIAICFLVCQNIWQENTADLHENVPWVFCTHWLSHVRLWVCIIYFCTFAQEFMGNLLCFARKIPSPAQGMQKTRLCKAFPLLQISHLQW